MAVIIAAVAFVFAGEVRLHEEARTAAARPIRLCYRFEPRIRNIGDTRPYTPTNDTALPALARGTINTATILLQWDEILRLATSIKAGTVTASLRMRKLGAYPARTGSPSPCGNWPECNLFLLDWLLDPRLRRKVTVGLNKGKALNALARGSILQSAR